MFRYYFIFSVIIILAIGDETVSNIQDSANTPIKLIEADNFVTDEKGPSYTQTVSLKLFYESLCPDCIEFDPVFVKVAKKLREYVEVKTYPYGNAHMTKNADGSVSVECQHGVPECYGNKLHACAIDILVDEAVYLDYNACLMEHRSNNTAAEQCGKSMDIDSSKVEDIKNCAEGARGQQLLVHYGEESDRVNFNYVPFVLINGVEWKGETEDFMKDVCAAFGNQPKPCLRLQYLF